MKKWLIAFLAAFILLFAAGCDQNTLDPGINLDEVFFTGYESGSQYSFTSYVTFHLSLSPDSQNCWLWFSENSRYRTSPDTRPVPCINNTYWVGTYGADGTDGTIICTFPTWYQNTMWAEDPSTQLEPLSLGENKVVMEVQMNSDGTFSSPTLTYYDNEQIYKTVEYTSETKMVSSFQDGVLVLVEEYKGELCLYSYSLEYEDGILVQTHEWWQDGDSINTKYRNGKKHQTEIDGPQGLYIEDFDEQERVVVRCWIDDDFQCRKVDIFPDSDKSFTYEPVFEGATIWANVDEGGGLVIYESLPNVTPLHVMGFAEYGILTSQTFYTPEGVPTRGWSLHQHTIQVDGKEITPHWAEYLFNNNGHIQTTLYYDSNGTLICTEEQKD